MRIDDRGISIGDPKGWNQSCCHCCGHGEYHTVAVAELNWPSIEHEFRDMVQGKLQGAEPRAKPDFGALHAKPREGWVDKGF